MSVPMECDDIPLQQVRSRDDQLQHQSGGFVFETSTIQHLKRLLILGHSRLLSTNEGSTQSDIKKLVINLIEEGRGCQVVQILRDFGEEGRCGHRSALIYCLALCVTAKFQSKEHGGVLFTDVKRAAYDMLSKICFIPTDLFQFVRYCEEIRKEISPSYGWGRSHRRAIKKWYLEKPEKHLAYLVTKYKKRKGWSHKRLLNLLHIKPGDCTKSQEAIFRYISRGYTAMKNCFVQKIQEEDLCSTLGVLYAVHRASLAEREEDVVDVIKNHNLVHEQVPNKFLRSREVWKAMLSKGIPKMGIPMMALIRNLGRITAMRLFENEDGHSGDKCLQNVCDQLRNEENLCGARIHPICILIALRVYETGTKWKGSRGLGVAKYHRDWIPKPQIVEALNDAFFKTVKCSTQKRKQRCFIAIDVSDSMFGEPEDGGHRGGGPIKGCHGLSMLLPAEASAAMAMVALQANQGIDEERQSVIMAFSQTMTPLNVTHEMKLSEVLEHIRQCESGRTDCAQPMIYAMDNDILVNTFIIFTDNETNCGDIQPFEALHNYRAYMRSRQGCTEEAKLIVCAMTSTNFTIAKPEDPGMLDVPGFDRATPKIISEFAAL